ncbi:hypothetical protein [Adhaeribacter soli]|uniref:Uncharacterized protein n=1 Tax=Adhaeribacter soli TaxID=2607655 RepID=A0A5N1IQF0_9BACT|nr:hypothetical protein [Adhaeribacter soli]KAA9331988.1 hypothetical protein F0P94_14435 [Adhaeribacter soli]
MDVRDQLTEKITEVLTTIEGYKNLNGITWFYEEATTVLFRLQEKVINGEKIKLELQNSLFYLITITDRLSEDSILSKQLWKIDSLIKDYIWERF